MRQPITLVAVALVVACGCSYRLSNDSRQRVAGLVPRARAPVAKRLIVYSARLEAWRQDLRSEGGGLSGKEVRIWIGRTRVVEAEEPRTLEALVRSSGLAKEVRPCPGPERDPAAGEKLLAVRPLFAPRHYVGGVEGVPLRSMDTGGVRNGVKMGGLLVFLVPWYMSSLLPPLAIIAAPFALGGCASVLLLAAPFDFIYVEEEPRFEVPFELVVTAPGGEELVRYEMVSRVKVELQGYAEPGEWLEPALTKARMEAEEALVARLVRDTAALERIRGWKPRPGRPLDAPPQAGDATPAGPTSTAARADLGRVEWIDRRAFVVFVRYTSSARARSNDLLETNDLLEVTRDGRTVGHLRAREVVEGEVLFAAGPDSSQASVSREFGEPLATVRRGDKVSRRDPMPPRHEAKSPDASSEVPGETLLEIGTVETLQERGFIVRLRPGHSAKVDEVVFLTRGSKQLGNAVVKVAGPETLSVLPGHVREAYMKGDQVWKRKSR